MYVRWLVSVTWDPERWWWCSVARPRRLTNRGSRPAHRPFPEWCEQRNRPYGLLSRRWLLTHLFASFHHNFSVFILCSCLYISLYSIVVFVEYFTRKSIKFIFIPGVVIRVELSSDQLGSVTQFCKCPVTRKLSSGGPRPGETIHNPHTQHIWKLNWNLSRGSLKLHSPTLSIQITYEPWLGLIDFQAVAVKN